MKRIAISLGVFGLLAVLAACAPGAEVPGAEERVYAGGQEEVFAVVVRAISTSPGIPGSNGWIITNSDNAGGFIAAETRGFRSTFLGLGSEEFYERISVVVTGQSSDRTSVVIQGTSGADDLADRIIVQLEAEFERIE